MSQAPNVVHFAAKHRTSAFVITSLTALCVFAAIDLDTARTFSFGVRDATVSYFDWLFVYVVSGALIIVFLLALHPNASRRIAPER